MSEILRVGIVIEYGGTQSYSVPSRLVADKIILFKSVQYNQGVKGWTGFGYLSIFHLPSSIFYSTGKYRLSSWNGKEERDGCGGTGGLAGSHDMMAAKAWTRPWSLLQVLLYVLYSVHTCKRRCV